MPDLMDNYTIPQACSVANRHSAITRPLVSNHLFSGTSFTVFVISEPGLNDRIVRLLNEYAQLNENWDDEGAQAISQIVIARAKAITGFLGRYSQPIYHAAPGPNGEILLDLRNKRKNRSIEFILYTNRSVVVLIPATGKPEQRNFDSDDLPNLLQWLNQM